MATSTQLIDMTELNLASTRTSLEMTSKSPTEESEKDEVCPSEEEDRASLSTCESDESKKLDTSWYKSIIVVPNKGSTARDHLANERTYLSEFRFCLVVIVLGMSIIGEFRFGSSEDGERPIGLYADWTGIAWVAIGILLSLFCGINYFVMQMRYVKSRAPLQNFKAVLPVIALMAIAICTFTISALIKQD